MNGNRFIIVLLLVLLRASAIGQTPFEFGPSPCLSAPGFNQLNFWIGNWIVYNTSNTAIGMDTVHSVLDDCVIEEKWTRNNGSRGKSYNTYNKLHNKFPYSTKKSPMSDDPSLSFGWRSLSITFPVSTSL